MGFDDAFKALLSTPPPPKMNIKSEVETEGEEKRVAEYVLSEEGSGA